MKLYLGDCLEELTKVPDGSVDMVLTDLPYGTTANKWDNVIPFEPMWAQLNRVCKENAAMVFFAQIPFAHVLGASNIKNLRYEWIWEKLTGSNFLNANLVPMKCHENILVFYRKGPDYFPQGVLGKPFGPTAASRDSGSQTMVGHQAETYRPGLEKGRTVNKGTRKPRSIQRFVADKSRVHPTQKPVGLLKFLIRTYTKTGGTVLDITMGSGSTGVAAKLTKRDFIGIEMSEKYFEIAKRRIADANFLDLAKGAD